MFQREGKIPQCLGNRDSPDMGDFTLCNRRILSSGRNFTSPSKRRDFLPPSSLSPKNTKAQHEPQRWQTEIRQCIFTHPLKTLAGAERQSKYRKAGTGTSHSAKEEPPLKGQRLESPCAGCGSCSLPLSGASDSRLPEVQV